MQPPEPDLQPGTNKIDMGEWQLSQANNEMLCEICHIGIRAAATSLSTILRQTVYVSAPSKKIFRWSDMRDAYGENALAVLVRYVDGLSGSNVLLLKERDVKIITDIMMGGTGAVSDPIELNEIDLSAIGEAMNQIVGGTATLLSFMLQRKIDIATPKIMPTAYNNDVDTEDAWHLFSDNDLIVAFQMKIGDILESEIVQVLQKSSALELIASLKDVAIQNDSQPTTE